MSRLDARHPLIENVCFIIVLEGGMKAANGLLGTTFRSLAFGSKHVTRSQKERWMLNKISQNQTFIFLLAFKTIVIMAS
jgi:hypothetical protein